MSDARLTLLFEFLEERMREYERDERPRYYKELATCHPEELEQKTRVLARLEGTYRVFQFINEAIDDGVEYEQLWEILKDPIVDLPRHDEPGAYSDGAFQAQQRIILRHKKGEF